LSRPEAQAKMAAVVLRIGVFGGDDHWAISRCARFARRPAAPRPIPPPIKLNRGSAAFKVAAALLPRGQVPPSVVSGSPHFDW
jgi:hypothetical protein